MTSFQSFQADKKQHNLLEHTSAGVHRSGAKRLPDDGLADVCGDKERNSRPKAIALLEEFVQE